MNNIVIERIKESYSTHSELLDLWGCNITDLSFITDMTWVTEIDLSFNHISDITPLQSLSNLTMVLLNSNQLTDVTPLKDLSNLTYLRLNLNQLTDVTPLKGLGNLAYLNLGENKITDVMPLQNLNNLTYLNLNENKLTDLTPLQNLSNLTELFLGSNQLTDITPLQNLNNLTELDISDNKIVDVTPLQCLGNLIILNLMNILITDVSFLQGLRNLTILNLSRNYITDLSPLQQFKNLTKLYLGLNQITDISALQSTVNLQKLVLIMNNITDITPLQGLSNLEELHLSSNQITDISSLQGLKNLTSLSLDSNQLTDISPLLPLLKKGTPIYWKWQLDRKGIIIEDNSLDPALIARIHQGNQAVIDYYQELTNSKKIEELYEARLMVIGEPRAGKTTLQRKLRDIESALPLDSESTEGISTGEETDIDTYKSQFSFTNDKGQTVPFYYTIWDFGGQRQYHPSHQLFFAKNAVYLLVTNTNWNKNEEDVEYWLSTVRKLGIDSPVLRVSNMPNDRPDESDWSLVEQAYGKMIKDVFSVNLKRINKADTAHFDKNDHKEFIRLKDMIEVHLKNLPHIGSTVPKVWTDIRKALTTVEGNPPYISWADFVAICKRFHYDDPVRQQRLSQTFHDLGIFLHYQNNPVLKDTVILKNKWAIDAVFAVVDSRLIGQQKGAFTDNDLPTIWSKPTYRGKEQELLNLLKEFELCYPLSGNRGYVAPQRLPKAPPPQYEWNHADNVRVDIEYDFLPRTVIIRLIVKLHQHIHEDKNWVWQNGVVISGHKMNYPDTYARIQENHKQKTLSLQLRGAYSEDLFKEIQSKLSDIYDDFPKLDVEYHIYCNCEDCKLSSRPTRFRYYEQLLHYRRVLNRDTIECQTKGKAVPISQILRGIVSKEQAMKDSRHGTYIENLHIGDWVGGDKIGRDKIGRDKFEG